MNWDKIIIVAALVAAVSNLIDRDWIDSAWPIIAAMHVNDKIVLQKRIDAMQGRRP